MDIVERKKAMRLWNSGMSIEKAIATHGIDPTAYFAEFERRIGCRSFTMAELKYGKIGAEFEEQELSEEYKEWKGITGPGKQLREAISLSRQSSEK